MTPARPLRVILAGDWAGGVHEEPMAHALESLGHVVYRFAWGSYFSADGGAKLGQLYRRSQNRWIFGPLLEKLNGDLHHLSLRAQPDVLLVRRGTHVRAATLKRIRAAVPNVVLVSLCNDDPFAPGRERGVWRHFLRAVPAYDLVLAYRHQNLEEFARIGARRVELMRSWFVPERDHPYALTAAERTRYATDIVFAGHYEPDARIRQLNALVSAGIGVKVFGPDYPRSLDAPCLAASRPVRPLPPVEYAKALCGAKIALCFLSKINRDTYTRRCFEIPATGTMMLCEHSSDVASLYTEGVEAEFFRSTEELLAKAKRYLADDARRRSVAESGYRRVLRDGHDVVSRMRRMLQFIDEVRGARVDSHRDLRGARPVTSGR